MSKCGDDMKLFEFCRLIGALKHLKRTGWVKRGVPEPETVACHMYRMAVLAFTLDKDSVDRDKCIRMALVHDMAEAIVGDITPHCGVDSEQKYKLEKEAMEKLTSFVPKSVGDEFLELWHEFEKCESPEAKAVKDLDRYDMVMQAFEYEEGTKKPGSLQEFFDSTKGKFETAQVKSWVKSLNNVRDS